MSKTQGAAAAGHRDSGRLLPELVLQSRGPRHEAEAELVVDHGESPGGGAYPLRQTPATCSPSAAG
jgi:hypothetical protein